jgi:hypothetical protein
MGSLTLLQLINQASGQLGLAQQSIVIGNSNNQTTQFLALTQQLGRDLIRDYEWNGCTKINVFQTSAALTKTGTSISGATTLTSLSNTTSLVAGMVITGTGIAPFAEILSVDSSTQVTMNLPATASGSAVTFTFAYQDYALPADYDRMVADTNWDRTNHWSNLGSRSSQDWATLQGGLISVGPRERFRIYGNKLRIFPALTSVYNLAFEYVSNYWITATGGTSPTKSAFSVDTDTCIFADDLMLTGIKYYFLRAKKLDYAMEFQDFQRTKSERRASDVPIPAKSLAPIQIPNLVGPWSIPEGSWNL